ncbi:MAG: FmdB family zinc ribbon protein [Anaerolineae bacterium]
MPTYQYECEECGLVFERRQHFNDAPLKRCPECQGPVHRVFQPVGIIFKGSGFYVTDHRASSPTATPGEPKNGSGAPKKDAADKKAGDGEE